MSAPRVKVIVFLACAGAMVVLSVFAGRWWTSWREEQAMRHNNLGAALFDRGCLEASYFEEAVKEFEAAHELRPDYRLARVNLGISLFYAGQSQRSLAFLEEAIAEDPGDLHARFSLALVELNLKAHARAKGHLLKVLEADPADSDAWYNLGICQEALGEARDAIESLRRSIVLLPSNPIAFYRLARLLQAAGEKDAAAELLEQFERLGKSGRFPMDDPRIRDSQKITLGKYARVRGDSRHAAAGNRPPRYEDVTASAGLGAQAPPRPPAEDVRQALEGRAMPGDWFRNDAKRGPFLDALSSACALVDFDNDGKLDVSFIDSERKFQLFRQIAGGRFAPAAEAAGLANLPEAVSTFIWGDYDNNELPDLFLSGRGGVRLFNNQAGTLVDATAASGLAAAFPPGAAGAEAAFSDLDHDADLDLLVGLLPDLDRLPGKELLRFPDDFKTPPLLLLRNNGDGTFTDIAREAMLPEDIGLLRGLASFDADDDGAADIVLTEQSGRTTVLRNRRDGSFERSSAAPADRPPLLPFGEAISFGDYDGDGAIDRLVAVSGAGARLERNLDQPLNWLTVRVRGLARPGNVRSNRLGIGARVEVRTVGTWETKELRAGNGASGTDAAEATFQLGKNTRLDSVRVAFPSGRRFAEKEVGSNQVIVIEEPERPPNSCPGLFTWNGGRFDFITDTLSAGILGELTAPGRYWEPDGDEWIRVASAQLKPRSREAPARGETLEVRFVNALEEVTYLDQARLVAVDHPAGAQAHPGERMVGESGNRAPVRLYLLENLRPVAGASDHRGADAASALAAIDRAAVGPDRLLPYQGFAEDWSLTMDLGDPAALRSAGGRPPVLLLHGWSFWNSSAAIVAAAQSGKSLRGPVLEALDAAGTWQMRSEDLGIPAGLPRTMLIDLEKLLDAGEHVVRIRTNRMLYFDQALVARTIGSWLPDSEKPPPAVASTEAPLSSAELRWLGYPRRILPDGKEPEVFDYHDLEPAPGWETHQGLLTRFGDVTPLIAERDDRFAVLEHGEEIALSFDAGRLPKLAGDRERTYLIYLAGYEKGIDHRAPATLSVEPLPFRAAPAGLGRGASITPAEIEYLLEWNTRPAFLRGAQQ